MPEVYGFRGEQALPEMRVRGHAGLGVRSKSREETKGRHTGTAARREIKHKETHPPTHSKTEGKRKSLTASARVYSQVCSDSCRCRYYCVQEMSPASSTRRSSSCTSWPIASFPFPVCFPVFSSSSVPLFLPPSYLRSCPVLTWPFLVCLLPA